MRPRAIRPAVERFWEKVNKAGPVPAHRPELGPCWIWMGAKSRDGYGRFRPGRAIEGTAQAQRWSLEQALGRPLALDNHACHHCDNPACVNNEGHLFDGTPRENEQDKLRKGRTPRGDRHGSRTKPWRMPRGENNAKAKLTEGQVREIRGRLHTGETQAGIARSLGVTPTIISRILSGKIWKHVA